MTQKPEGMTQAELESGEWDRPTQDPLLAALLRELAQAQRAQRPEPKSEPLPRVRVYGLD